MTPQQASMSKETLLTPPTSPPPPDQDGHQPDIRHFFMPQPQALVHSITSTLEDHAQHYQGPSKSARSTKDSQSQSNPRASDAGRLLILCFDGTGNKFGEVSAGTL